MPVATTDIKFYKSSVGVSEGGTKSATVLVSGVKNGLWEDISDVDRLAGSTRYKKFFVANEHPSDSLLEPVFYLSQSPIGITESLGLGFNHADDDSVSAATLSAFSANAVASLQSSAADTRSVTLYGVDSGGGPQSEVIVLTGTSPVLGAVTWSKVWAMRASATHGSNTVTLKQGSGGTTRGTIGPTLLTGFLWVVATSRTNGILLPSLAASGDYGFWSRQDWPTAVAAARPARSVYAIEETI